MQQIIDDDLLCLVKEQLVMARLCLGLFRMCGLFQGLV